MKTPNIKKESTRRAQTRMSDKGSESTDITMVDQVLPEEIVLVSEPPHQTHGLPITNLSNLKSSHNYNSFGRQRRSVSTMPIRTADEDAESKHISGHHGASARNDEGIRLIGLEVSRLQNAIFDLHKYGVHHVAPLPELVVVGDQSAGKSSLIGGLAEIHLPRSTGTCTRCPIFIKTTSSQVRGASWICKISLLKHWSHVPGLEGQFGPWKESQPEEIEFETIEDRGDLERVLKWAQVAILNPSQNSKGYRGHPRSNDDASIEVKFSPNIISMDIIGPNLPSLSFYDLPGIIQNADESNLVVLVQNLVEYYIKRNDALILCALPMSSDPANSSAIHYVRKNKAEHRCIGVLTKPDLLQDSEFATVWLPLLRGELDGFKLGYDYYVTKQPVYNGNEPLKDHSTARDEEEDFFMEEPWAVQSDELRARCGTMSLQRELALALTKQIKDRLPDITLKIEQRKLAIDAELKKLPELPDDDLQQGVVLQKLSQFSMEAQKKIGGDSGHNEFQRQWKYLRDKFQHTIAELKPKMGLSDETDKTSIPPQRSRQNGQPSTPLLGFQEIVDLESEDDERTVGNIQRTLFKNEPSTPTPKRHRGPANVRRADFITGSPAKRMKTCEDSQLNEPKPRVFTLREVKDTIQKISIGDFPGETDPQVTKDLSMKAVEPWTEALNTLMAATMNLVFNTITDALAEVLSSFSRTELYTKAKDHIFAFFNDIEVRQRNRIESLLKVELEEPMTLDHTNFNRNKDESLQFIEDKRHTIRVKAHLDRQENTDHKFTYDRQRLDKASRVTKANLPTDPFKTEIEVMSKVRGYYLTAYPRFVDNVALCFKAHMFNDIKESIKFYLENELEVSGAGGIERCRRLLDEHPEVAETRRKLQFEKSQLELASDRLKRLAEDGEVYRQHASAIDETQYA